MPCLGLEVNNAACVSRQGHCFERSYLSYGRCHLLPSQSVVKLPEFCHRKRKLVRKNGLAVAVQCCSGCDQSHPSSSSNAHVSGPFASLTRALLIGQPSTMFRTIASRRVPAGPMSLLLFLFGLLAAAVGAVRAALVKRVKDCKMCRGFGINRCPLCSGLGMVDWRAKFGHSEICPLCMTRRYVVCTECGGHYHRRMFVHFRSVGKSLGDMYNVGSADGPGYAN